VNRLATSGLLDDTVRVFGPDHENAMVCRNNLARAHEPAGRPERLTEAVALYERVTSSVKSSRTYAGMDMADSEEKF
jgi:hypothetical protein